MTFGLFCDGSLFFAHALVAQGSKASSDSQIIQISHGVAEVFQHIVNAILVLANAVLVIMGVVFLYRFASTLTQLPQRSETDVSFLDLRNSPDLPAADREISAQALTELVAARLQYILRIHDMAYQSFQDDFKQREIIDNSNYSDVTSVLQEFDIQPILIEDPTHLAIRPSTANVELGHISTTAGPMDAKLSLSGIQKLFRTNRVIKLRGSMQNYAGMNRLVGMLANQGKTWGWIIDEKDIKEQMSKQKSQNAIDWAPELAKELAYHAANRILSETSDLIDILPGSHFRTYTDLLKTFTDYLQNNVPESVADRHLTGTNQAAWSNLKKLYLEFHHKEPSNIRTYYISYVLAVLSIYKKDYQYADKLLKNAVAIEASVISVFMTFFPDPTRLGWDAQMVGHYKKMFPPQNMLKRVLRTNPFFYSRQEMLDRKKATELAKGLANVNLALGFTLERLAEEPTEKSASQYLEDATDAYLRALDFRQDDPLLLSNLARVLLKRADHLSSEKVNSGEDLALTYQAEEVLNKVSSTRDGRNVKYAFNQKALFCLAKGELLGAIKNYELALTCDHQFLIAQRSLANTFSLQGKHDLAIEALTTALHRVGHSHEPQINLEYIHAWLHNSRAWAYFSKARMLRLKEFPTHPKKGLDNKLDIKPDHTSYKESQDVSAHASLLALAKEDLYEASKLIEIPGNKDSSVVKRLNTVIGVNQLFIRFEELLLGSQDRKTSVEDLLPRVRGFIDKNRPLQEEKYRPLSDNDYIQVLCGDYAYCAGFSDRWRRSTVTALDYQYFLVDIVLLCDYITSCLILLRLDTPRHPQYRRFLRMNSCFRKSIRLMEAELNPVFVGLAYLRHQLPRWARHCWLDSIKALMGKPKTFASTLSLYLLLNLLTFYFGKEVASPFSSVRKQFNDQYDKVFEELGEGRSQDSHVINLLREGSKLGVALRENGPYKRMLADQDCHTEGDLAELKAIFLPVDCLFEAVNIAKLSAKPSQVEKSF